MLCETKYVIPLLNYRYGFILCYKLNRLIISILKYNKVKSNYI